MAIGPRLDLRQSQSLVMTPQLRQAIKLLQFTNVEVSAFIEEELERNPLLERDERDDAPPPERAAIDQMPSSPGETTDAAEILRGDELMLSGGGTLDHAEHAETYDPGSASDGMGSGRGAGSGFDDDDRGIDDLAGGQTTLRDHLGEQLRLSFHDRRERLIGAHLIAMLEPSGRLSAPPEALAQAMGCDLAEVESVRARMMRFDPTGMFARDLRECLAVQLAEKNRLDPAMAALLDNLELLARRDLRKLMQICGVDAADMSDMIAEIRALDPKPGANWENTPLMPVVPDVLMRAAPIASEEGGWLLELNPETMPRVLVNQSFSARVLPRCSREDRAFLTEKLQTANWLVKSLHQRAQTILKVSSEIVRQQEEFFQKGVGHLRPLILRDIADAVEMHESTVSRVTAGKYIATPRGIFELKYFFTTAISGTSGGESHSAESVRHRIREMVARETAATILSDDAIVAALRAEGVDIARRTVAKYRDALRIPSSVQRKREKAEPV
jgi:RNA polymerase sigma-54 factor